MTDEHRAHLSAGVSNANTGTMRYRIACSCGWVSEQSAYKRVVWSALLRHAPDHIRDCDCWARSTEHVEGDDVEIPESTL